MLRIHFINHNIHIDKRKFLYLQWFITHIEKVAKKQNELELKGPLWRVRGLKSTRPRCWTGGSMSCTGQTARQNMCKTWIIANYCGLPYLTLCVFLSGSPRKLWTARSSWTSWPWYRHVRLCWTGSYREGPRPSQVHEGRPSLRKPAAARRRGRCHAQVAQQPDWKHTQPGGIQEESRSHLQGPEALPPWLEERWVAAETFRSFQKFSFKYFVKHTVCPSEVTLHHTLKSDRTSQWFK